MRISDWSSDVCSSDLIWKGIGWSMLIFLAALTAVPKELNEAAALDGAGAWGRFRNVSLPTIRSAMAVVVRSEARRVGTACVSTCRSRWSPYHQKHNITPPHHTPPPTPPPHTPP